VPPPVTPHVHPPASPSPAGASSGGGSSSLGLIVGLVGGGCAIICAAFVYMMRWRELARKRAAVKEANEGRPSQISGHAARSKAMSQEVETARASSDLPSAGVMPSPDDAADLVQAWSTDGPARRPTVLGRDRSHKNDGFCEHFRERDGPGRLTHRAPSDKSAGSAGSSREVQTIVQTDTGFLGTAKDRVRGLFEGPKARAQKVEAEREVRLEPPTDLAVPRRLSKMKSSLNDERAAGYGPETSREGPGRTTIRRPSAEPAPAASCTHVLAEEPGDGVRQRV